MKTLAVHNIKGGVGKTTTAVNLAHLAAAGGARTLVWDMDPQGAATFFFRVRAKRAGHARALLRGRRDLRDAIRGSDFEHLDVVRAHFSFRKLDLALAGVEEPAARLRALLAPLRAEYDLLVYDCAPGLNLTAECVFRVSDVVLVPTIPTTLSLRTLEQLRGHLQERGPAGLAPAAFLSMFDARRALHREVRAAALDDPGFLDACVPYASVVERMGIRRAPVTSYARASTAGRAYATLWREVRALLGL